MSSPRVLATPPFLRAGDEIDRRLLEAGVEPVYNPWHGGRTEEEMIDLLQGIDGAIVSLDPITRRVLEAADRLKVVARTGVGYNDIDVPAATDRGIAICTAAGANRHAVAEFVFAVMLQHTRRLAENQAELRRGGWAKRAGIDLAGKTLGLVGLGAIGKEVAQRARAFEMRILAHDLFQDPVFADEHQVAFVPLEQLLRESDFVSLHVPLDTGTRHLLDADRLALMKPTAYLINTSRGGVVDAEAIYQALKEKRIAGAALDVFEREPLDAASPLRELENVYLSPHVAGVTDEARAAATLAATENVLRVLRGERPLHIVNPEVLK